MPQIVLASALVCLGYAQRPAEKPHPIGDFTGMFTFLQEGEYVQLTLDPAPDAKTDWSKPLPLTGYVSRLGTAGDDKDRPIEHFFKSGSLEGTRIRFTTKVVHGTWYDFDGKITRDDKKTPDKEGYYVVRGLLTEHTIDKDKKDSAQQRELTMKSFPNLDAEPEKPWNPTLRHDEHKDF